MTPLSWVLLPLTLGLVLLSVRHLRNADLPKSVTGLDRAQKKAVKRAVGRGTAVETPELAAAACGYARFVIAEHERNLHQHPAARLLVWGAGAVLLVTGVMTLADDPRPGDYLTPVYAVLAFVLPFVNPAFSRHRIARAEDALIANGQGAPIEQ